MRVVNGGCGSLSYENSMQSVGGFITMGGSRQSTTYDCPTGVYTAQCLEVESSYWDAQCPTGANPPFCDYRSTCSPWHGGNPTIVSGTN
jgi:hypothetical protein